MQFIDDARTGRDADRGGVYLSGCCLAEVPFIRGQMFARCPRCYALTTWELQTSERELQARQT